MAGGADRPVAICEGGPWDRWAYYVEDIEERRSSALAMGYPFEYRPTGQRDDKDRLVWAYRPAPPASTLPPEPAQPPAAPRPVIWTTNDLDPVPCLTCGEPTYRLARNGTVLILDTDTVRGGLWRFDDRGRPARRSTAEVYEETRSAAPGYAGGYPAHECAATPEVSRGSPD